MCIKKKDMLLKIIKNIQNETILLFSKNNQMDMKKILFVCMSNIRRSQMAEAIFTKLTGIKAMSAGIDPAEKVDENVITILKEIGIDMGKTKPKKVTNKMLEWADKIITFRCDDKLPDKFKHKIENWELGVKRNVGDKPPERGLDEIRETRDLIYPKIKKLVDELNE